MTSAVGVLITRDAVLCSWSGVVSATPVLLARHDGVVLHGASAVPVLNPADAVGTLDVFRHIDDERIALAGGDDVRTVDVLSGLVDDAVRHAGVPSGECDLVVVHPPHWGPVRRDVLTVSARPHARDVLLVSSAVVACDAAQSLRPCSCDAQCRVVVVDRAPRRTTVSTVVTSSAGPDVVACVLVDATVPVTEDIAVATGIGSAIDEAGAVTSVCRVIVHGESDAVSLRDIESLTSVPVVALDDGDLATAIVPCVQPVSNTRTVVDDMSVVTPLPPVRSGAWLAERTAAMQPTRRFTDRRVLVGVAVSLAVMACIAVATAVSTRGADDFRTSNVAEMVDAVPTVRAGSATSGPPVTSTEASPPGREFRSAGLTLTVPTGWHVEPGTERVLLKPDVAAGMRIVLVTRELAVGLGVDDVAATVSARMASQDPSSTLDGLTRGPDVSRHPALVYSENASDGSTVDWTVIVSPGEQTSVGCQAAASSEDAMSALCAEVLTSIDLE
ncbi:hypothetical protein ASG56_01770 [Rhodococcus sp. Leaf7]|uniref:type VII secretion-associated protein n=1 Tax=unclassified Rhodococcus (in: high G+C Gram-positive bacteria) TaxID=192944 RepID=UPI0006F54004|nr:MULTISPECIES: type VII secretion-associated protein [unclassified Rhodococcus (in: high G+C Gram-positive bacteria)]KQU06431.1 hypothetical protein ASG56_01770 [Rhodococcus sp. Leaf7]KQU41949.1 hypothetical protein ASG64_01770 [Rhodococcus sp. Leaf247]